MKKASRIISVLLITAMLLSIIGIVPISAAQTEITDTGATSGTTGDCTWKFDGTVLIISGNGKMGNYSAEQKAPWGTDITKVILTDGVTSIGDYAFRSCRSLTSVTIPDSVTRIGDSAFSSCTGLTSIDIPDSVTSIGCDSFFGCSGLTDIKVSDGNPIYDSRNNCNAIIETENNTLVTGCKNTVIPNSVSSIGDYAFYCCTGLNSVTIPDSITSIAYEAFFGCSGLTNIKVSDGNPIYDSRNNCNAIIETENNTLVTGCKNTVIPNSVSSIGDYAFYCCGGLTSVIIPNSVSSIGDYAFYGCSDLTSVIIPDSVASIGSYAFNGTAWYYNQPDGLVYAGKVAYTMKGDCPAVVQINDGTTGIANQAFSWCYNLTSVNIPDSVMSIGNYAFISCKNLTSVTIPDSVTSIGEWAFRTCSSLTTVTIGNSVTSIGEMTFCDCDSLTSVNIGNSVTSIGDSAFSRCYNLTSVSIPDSVTSIGKYAFDDCISLTSVNIPNSVTSIGDQAFGFYYYNGHKVRLNFFTIYGYTGSEAERYANKNKFNFISIGIAPKPGDVDGDGVITPMDVTEVQHYLSGMTTHADEETLMFADVDKNGLLEVIDTTYLLRYLAGMEIPYTIG